MKTMYLLNITVGVADEGSVMMTDIYSEGEMNALIGSKFSSGFGNLEGDDGIIEKDDFVAITEDDDC